MRSEEYKLNREGVYVIGQLIKSSFGTDHGWMYEYEYYYDKKKFIREFTGPLNDSIRNDSVLFFKILPQNPSVCRQVLDTRVPDCYKRENIKKNTWRKIFTCAELDKIAKPSL
jgi:hypothetical protein